MKLKFYRTTIPVSFLLLIPFPVVFIDLKMLKIGCVNYAPFPNPVTINVNENYSAITYKDNLINKIFLFTLSIVSVTTRSKAGEGILCVLWIP